jgi:hypothetical protein
MPPQAKEPLTEVNWSPESRMQPHVVAKVTNWKDVVSAIELAVGSCDPKRVIIAFDIDGVLLIEDNPVFGSVEGVRTLKEKFPNIIVLTARSATGQAKTCKDLSQIFQWKPDIEASEITQMPDGAQYYWDGVRFVTYCIRGFVTTKSREIYPGEQVSSFDRESSSITLFGDRPAFKVQVNPRNSRVYLYGLDMVFPVGFTAREGWYAPLCKKLAFSRLFADGFLKRENVDMVIFVEDQTAYLRQVSESCREIGIEGYYPILFDFQE